MISAVRRLNGLLAVLTFLAIAFLTLAGVESFAHDAPALNSSSVNVPVDRAYRSSAMSGATWRCSDRHEIVGDHTIMTVEWNRARLSIDFMNSGVSDNSGEPLNDIIVALHYGGAASNHFGLFSNHVIGVAQFVDRICLIRTFGQDRPLGAIINNAQGSGCCYDVQIVQATSDKKLIVSAAQPVFEDTYLTMAPFHQGVAFIGADMSFATANWGGGSNTSYPVRVITFDGSKFIDVTSSFPDVVSADATYQYSMPRSAYFRQYTDQDSRPYYVAWIADRCRLAAGSHPLRQLSMKMTAHQLVSPSSPSNPADSMWGSTFISAVEAMLGTHHLCQR